MGEVRGEKALLPYLSLAFFLGFCTLCTFGRRSGLMVSALASGASGPVSSLGRGHCAVFLLKSVPLSAQVYKWVPANSMLGVTLAYHPVGE